MIDPKDLYRKMDTLLARIGKTSDDEFFLPKIMRTLEAAFDADLHFSYGRIYLESGSTFALADYSDQWGKKQPVSSIPADTPAVQQVLMHGSFIFDSLDDPAPFCENNHEDPQIPAAFVVKRGPNRRWIFVYNLRTGWGREETQLCMNAVRSAVNYRLLSETIKGEFQQAAEIQSSLLPAKAPVFQGFEIAHRSQPAETVGGDLYDYVRFSDDIIGISVGDASGHGLPAALVVRDVVTGLRMGLEEEMKMVYTLKKLNRVIHRSMLSSRFVSLFYCEIESNGNLLYVNAGHPPPLLIAESTVQKLTRTGMILGALQDLPLRRGYTVMPVGSVLLLYSDGIFERRNSDKDMFGMGRLTDLVKENHELPAKDLVDRVFDEVFRFGDENTWEDDATIVVIKRITA